MTFLSFSRNQTLMYHNVCPLIHLSPRVLPSSVLKNNYVNIDKWLRRVMCSEQFHLHYICMRGGGAIRYVESDTL